MKIDKNDLIRIAAIAAVYAAACILMRQFGNDSGMIAAVIVAVPLICGIFFGIDSAIGVLIGSIIVSIVMGLEPAVSIGYILTSPAASLCIYRCFLSFKKSGDNDYIYNSRSLFDFIISSVIVAAVYYLVLSLLFSSAGYSMWGQYDLTRFDIIWTILIAGVLIMLVVSTNIHRSITEHPVHEEKWRYVLLLPLLICGIFVLAYDFIDINDTFIECFCIASMALYGLFGPSNRIQYDESEFLSVKVKGFSFMIILSSLLLAVLIITSDIIMGISDMGSDLKQKVCVYRALMTTLVFFVFVAGSYYIEKQITGPVYSIAKSVRNDDDAKSNELAILGDRLDFVANNKVSIEGNDFTLYIGLTKHDGSAQFDTKYAKELVDEICLRYVSGYVSSTEAVGGYRGEECAVSENVLTYRIFGASDEMIQNILNDVTDELEQESVLVIKNGVSKWYYFGKKK